MPVVARELTAPEVVAISTAGTHAVGGVTGLCLQVTASGARSWLLRITVGRHRREFGLGGFPTVALTDARDKARVLRERIGGGADPALQRRAASATRRLGAVNVATFRSCALAFLGAELTNGRDTRYAAATLRDLDRLAFGQIGDLAIDAVATDSILRVLKPIWTTTPAVATKLRGHMERVLNYAEVRGFRDGANPARWLGHLDGHLVSPRAAQRPPRKPSARVDQIPALFAALQQMPGIASVALQFLILTASRPREVLQMTWSDFDQDTTRWKVSSGGGKLEGARVIPLPRSTAQLLTALPRMGPSAPVFATPRTGRPLSDMALTAVLRRMNERCITEGREPGSTADDRDEQIVPSEFRQCFRSWAGQQPQHCEGAEYLLSTAPAAQAKPKAPDPDFKSAKRALEAWARHVRSRHAK
jgi:integrase